MKAQVWEGGRQQETLATFPLALSLFRRAAKLADKQVRQTLILSFGLSAWSANTNKRKKVTVRGSWMKPVPTPYPFSHTSNLHFPPHGPQAVQRDQGFGTSSYKYGINSRLQGYIQSPNSCFQSKPIGKTPTCCDQSTNRDLCSSCGQQLTWLHQCTESHLL